MVRAIPGKGHRMASKMSKWRHYGRVFAIVALLVAATAVHAQTPRQLGPPPPTVGPGVPNTPAVASDPMAVPGFWDPRRRPERPDLSRITIIRFLTESD